MILGENEEPNSKRRRRIKGRKNLGKKTMAENDETGEVGVEVLEEMEKG